MGEFLGNLDGEFPGGAQDDGLYDPLRCINFFNNGDAKCGCLTGAGLCLCGHVPPDWMRGMASAWIGVGSSKPIFSMAFVISFESERSENCNLEFISHDYLARRFIRCTPSFTGSGLSHDVFPVLPGYLTRMSARTHGIPGSTGSIIAGAILTGIIHKGTP